MSQQRAKRGKTGHRITIVGTRAHRADRAVLGTCASCHGAGLINQKMNYVEDLRTGKAWAWHEYCPKPKAVLELELRYAGTKMEDVRTADPAREAMEKAQAEMLTEIQQQFPNLSRREQLKLLATHTQELRRVWATEQAKRAAPDPACRCTHLGSEHIGGIGRCKYGDCDCDSFQERLQ